MDIVQGWNSKIILYIRWESPQQIGIVHTRSDRKQSKAVWRDELERKRTVQCICMVWPAKNVTAMSHLLQISLSPALNPVLLHVQVSGPVYSNILFCPAPISVLLHIYQQCSMYSDHFIITWSDLSASPHPSAMPQVLQSFNICCSNPSASPHQSTMFSIPEHFIFSYFSSPHTWDCSLYVH